MAGSNAVGVEIGQLLAGAHKRAARRFAEALTPLGIDGRLFGVLNTLGRLGPCTQARLVTELNGDKSTMMRTVDELEAMGLAVRQAVPGDRRARAVALTDEGRKRLAVARLNADHVAGELFAAMSETDRTALRDLLAAFLRDSPG
ncbi:MarR family winged helix-turn-helix transcriptional regulator [Actinoplanes subtropicus]|jgi:DNA-binding MarR family transcriptional regulator|uniref:MarR family winged helix-turn-helix transcriptional regulator n=1 Tax=Actinoplanes subtropicus TaxID=543632 RepID=UPI00068A782B|nr:MarR family transcriptional regulator [Actinoplanes subtropicus]